jgi:hypothetical protein|tara:strand:+ start:191 stop:706 length:516 start_codon:yes stop_codon:yes gene_type:complete
MDLKIVDDVLDEKFLKSIEHRIIMEKPWFFGYDANNHNDKTRSLTLGHTFDRCFFTDLENHLLSKIERLGIDTSKIYRCFYNCFRKCDMPKYHTDPAGHTYMFYLNYEWNKLWGAPTKFKKKKHHISKSVFPKPGRLVIFDSKLLHKGTAPSMFMPNKHPGRLSIAFHEER